MLWQAPHELSTTLFITEECNECSTLLNTGTSILKTENQSNVKQSSAYCFLLSFDHLQVFVAVLPSLKMAVRHMQRCKTQLWNEQ
jgi:hypothetical protein